MKAKEFYKEFDEKKSVIKHLDFSKARRPEQEQKRIKVDFPLWMIHSLDKRVCFPCRQTAAIPPNRIPSSE